MSEILKDFNEKGYVVLKGLLSNKNLINSYKHLKKDILLESFKLKKDKIGGSLIGNLNVFPGKYSQIFFNALLEANLNKVIVDLTKKNISEFDISAVGNLNEQYKYNQHFHTDGNFTKKYLIVNIATEDVSEVNGPLEIAPGTHKKEIPYWKFIFRKKRLKIKLLQGDVIIRSNVLWHRGTKNISRNPRFMMGFLLINKKDKLPEFNFHNNSEIKVFKNIFDSSAIGRIKESFYTRFSYLHSTARLFRSLFS